MEISNNDKDNGDDNKYKVDLIDPYEQWYKTDYIEDYLNLDSFDSLLPCIIISGQSKSGKTNVLLNLFKHRFIHKDIKFENMYFFSSTAQTSTAYKPLF